MWGGGILLLRGVSRQSKQVIIEAGHGIQLRNRSRQSGGAEGAYEGSRSERRRCQDYRCCSDDGSESNGIKKQNSTNKNKRYQMAMRWRVDTDGSPHSVRWVEVATCHGERREEKLRPQNFEASPAAKPLAPRLYPRACGELHYSFPYLYYLFTVGFSLTITDRD